MFRRPFHLLLLMLFCAPAVFAISNPAQLTTDSKAIDTDADGLSDALEQRLLVQFAPSFMVGRSDCAGVPAEFKAGSLTPLMQQENGTIYGQVSLLKMNTSGDALVEIHYFHLWGRDCGPHGHTLDTEHAAVLVRASSADLETATWKASYWYAAAHENTVCDVSQIARASTLGAEDHGAKVWISPGKHASYLSETLCSAGCGADRCEAMTPLETTHLINLGEPGRPMHGAIFAGSPEWPLEAKMTGSNFPPESLSRLDSLAMSDIAWANPGRHPAQGVIADSFSVEEAIAESGHNTTGAVSGASASTGNALQKSARNTGHALGKSARSVARALGIKHKDDAQD
jgi:hypothetical protein